MLEIAVFVAGLFAKAAAGMVIGVVMRKGLSFADQETKLIIRNEKEEQIHQHVFMDHQQSYKFCQADQCASF